MPQNIFRGYYPQYIDDKMLFSINENTFKQNKLQAVLNQQTKDDRTIGGSLISF